MKQDVRRILEKLSPKEREVLSLRFGLEDGQELSLAKVGMKLNFNREQVRRIEIKALAHLRSLHPSLALRDYFAS